jgi:TetR/AcrR family transcriptional repressor of nem operon
VPTQSRRVVPHKERLLGSGMRLLYRHGYHGTSVDAVLTDAGVPKGSFYHHFGSKEAFGFAVLDRYDAYQVEALARWATREDLAVPERLAGYHGELVDRFVASGWQRSCLVGKLSNELSPSSDAYRRRLAKGLAAWKGSVSALLAEGQHRGEVREDDSADRLADVVLAMIQGAFVAALALRERDYLSAVTRSLVDLVRAPAGSRDPAPAAKSGLRAVPAVRQQNFQVHAGKPRSHREALLREGVNQFFEHGYHGTTVDGLLEASGVPKGSFYHHFGSKESFAAAVLDYHGGFHRNRLAAWASRADLSTSELLSGYFAELSRVVARSGYRNGDLAGKLATEVAAASGPLRDQIAHLVRDGRAQLEQVLAEGQARGDVRTDREVTDLSAAIHALVDGAFIVAASTRDKKSLAAVSAAIGCLVIAGDSPVRLSPGRR